MKTAITVLQEMMTKLYEKAPEYECISQSGPHHLAIFEYRCRAYGLEATATAHSKRNAKQEAARELLRRLGSLGMSVPPEYASKGPPPMLEPPRSYVALLKELCEKQKLPPVEYEHVGVMGPPHMRSFTIRATVGRHSRSATANSKKTARQLAADQLYHYLLENIKSTRDLVEKDALVHAQQENVGQYPKKPAERTAKQLGMRLGDDHHGLYKQLDKETLVKGIQALDEARGHGPVVELGCAVGALGLSSTWEELPRYGHSQLSVLSLALTTPPLTFAGRDRFTAAAAATDYLRSVLPLNSATEAPANLGHRGPR